ncbi:MAG: hypothetical protein L6300_12450, partial [Syntrophaceae bacterium]|nr:hypothetical protein [Syntrophaceae bacterium]
MIKINLLPYREKAKKENLRQQITILSGTLVFFLLIILAGHLYFSTIIIPAMETKIREAEARLVVLNKKVGDIEGFKRDKKELEQKLEVINAL